jgi:hypothetical protein
MKYDVFISHASEDKESVARPLANQLQERGLRVWLDECELTLGDSLRRKIDEGLSHSRYAVVILSPAFFSKEWPNRELDGLVAREDAKEKVILPVWHNLNAQEVVRFSPILAGKLAVSTSHGIAHVATTVLAAIPGTSTDTSDAVARLAELESIQLQRIRREMLTSDSSRELRRSLYEIEMHLSRYPQSVEAKMLQDELKMAYQKALSHEIPSILGNSGPGYQKLPDSSPKRYRTRTKLFTYFSFIIILIALIITIYIVLRLTKAI